ncbi:MAG: hypothetical protein ACREIC_29295, partial [Limisphaerales bacterium]
MDGNRGNPATALSFFFTRVRRTMAGKIASFAVQAVERISPPELRDWVAMGGVVIFGLDQLEPADLGSALPFIERWQAAMSFQ